MITTLTKTQKNKMEFLIKKWIDLGLDTEPTSIAEFNRIIGNLNTHILKQEPVPIFVFNSPLESWIFINTYLYHNELGVQVVGSNLRDSKIGQHLGKSLWNQIVDQALPQIPDKWNTPIDFSKVSVNVSELKMFDFVYPYVIGSFWAYYFAWIETMEAIGVKNLPAEKDHFIEIHKIGFVFPLTDLIVATQKPSIIKKNKQGLHCENGPALAYSDGVSEFYYLNGVIMKKEQVMTPPEKMNSKEVLAEPNVEVRRELIRKMGIDRLVDELPHKIMDKQDNYELLSVSLSDEVPDARYLKMINPSIGVFHVEGVEGDTVEQALAFRARSIIDSGDTWNPSVLT